MCESSVPINTRVLSDEELMMQDIPIAKI